MRIEHASVTRELRDAGLAGVRVLQTGIGKDAILRALAAELESRRPVLVILAGACGALSHVDEVPPIARVIDEHGGSWTPALADSTGVSLIAVDRIVSTPADKQELAARTGAAIVDMEAHAFARFCLERGQRWTVVRGVSDTPDQTLPQEVLGWITPGGDTRSGRAAVDMLRKPWLIPHIVGVVRRSNRVLPKVGRRVAELILQSVPRASATGRDAHGVTERPYQFATPEARR